MDLGMVITGFYILVVRFFDFGFDAYLTKDHLQAGFTTTASLTSVV